MSLIRNDTVDITRYLPEYILKDIEIKGLLDTSSIEHERMRINIDDIFNQLFVSTATWGLSGWERVTAIKPSPSDSYKARRNRILLYLQSHQTSTVKYLEELSNRYIKDGISRIVENNPGYYFNVYIIGNIKNIKIDVGGIREAIDTYKPAHLDFAVILRSERQIALNSSGPLLTKVIPDSTWTERQDHIVFDAGLNSSGNVATRTSSNTNTVAHQAIVFTGGRTNGSFTTNRSGGYTVNRKDVGHDVTDTWSVFSGDRLNSRASPHTNDVASATKSRTYHQPNWQDVVSWDGVNTNGSAHKTNTWSDSKTVTKSERYFVHPLFSLNCMGSITSEHMDVGGDVEITETLFSGSTLNGSGASSRTDISTRTVTTRSIVFTGGRLNGRGRLLTNEASSRTDTSSQAITTETVSRIFAGPRTNGTIRTNSGMPERTTHTVHIPKWRNVLHRTSGATTNYSKHRTKTTEIIHTIPGRTEKRFDPSIGTLTNDHAVMGYLRL